MKDYRVVSVITLLILFVSFSGCTVDIAEDQIAEEPRPSLTDFEVQEIDRSHPLVAGFLDAVESQEKWSQLAKARRVAYDADNVGLLTREDGQQALVVPLISKQENDIDDEARYLIYSLSNGPSMLLTEKREGDSDLAIVERLETGEQITLRQDALSGKITLVTTAAGKTAGCWSNCMDVAVTSCMDDWGCTVMCGLMFKYCVTSMAIACGYVCYA